MQLGKSIINLPLLFCIVLSLALHGVLLHSYRSTYTPPKPKIAIGRTVIQLTLAPSMAAIPQPPKESLEETPEPVQEITPPKTEIRPVPTPAPIPVPPKAKPLEPKQEVKEELDAPETIPPKPAPIESIDQNASLIEDKGVTADAVPIDGIHPVYPRIAQRRGNEGTVFLSIEVLANGQPGKINITQSSGFKRLDEAAVKAARNATYVPAQKGSKNVASELIQPVTFELENNQR